MKRTRYSISIFGYTSRELKNRRTKYFKIELGPTKWALFRALPRVSKTLIYL